MRGARKHGFLGAILLGFLWFSFMLLTEAYFYFNNPFEMFGGASGYVMFGYGQSFVESLIFVGLGAVIGATLGVEKWRRTQHEPAGTAAAPRNRTARFSLIGLGLLVVLAGTSMILPRTRVAVVGSLRGEPCQRGLPVSYWIAELRSAAVVESRLNRDLERVYLSILLADDFGAEAVPGVAALLNDPNPVVRHAAIFPLHRMIGKEPPETTPIPVLMLGALLNDEDERVRWIARNTLRQIAGDIIVSDHPGYIGPEDRKWGRGNSLPLPVVIEIFETSAEKKIIELPDRFAAVLGKMGPQARAAVPALLRNLDSEGACGALKQIDPEAAAKAGVR